MGIHAFDAVAVSGLTLVEITVDQSRIWGKINTYVPLEHKYIGTYVVNRATTQRLYLFLAF